MRITDVVCYPYRIPFRQPFTTAHGTLTHRTGAIIEIHTNEGISGIGEMAPLPEFGRGTLAQAMTTLRDLIPDLQDEEFFDVLEYLNIDFPIAYGSRLVSSIVFALQTAIFDALGKHEQLSFSRRLDLRQEPRARVPVNVTIGSN